MTDERTAQIRAILDSYHGGTLLAMARDANLPLPAKGTPPKALVRATMEARFFTQERVSASLAHLDRWERGVLNSLLLRGGSAPTSSLRREVVRIGLVTQAEPSEWRPGQASVPYAAGGYVGSPDHVGSRVFEDVIARLTLHGLVFSRFGDAQDGGPYFKLQFHPADHVYIPAAVLQHLPPPRPIDAPPSEPAIVRRGEPELLLRDLYLYWDYVRRNDVPLTKAGLVSKRALRAINQQLLMPDPSLGEARSETDTARLSLLGRLLIALNLAEAHGGRLVAAGGALGIPEFWRLPQAMQLDACVEAWPRLPGLAELDTAGASYDPLYSQGREALLRALKAQAAGRWVEVEDLLDHIKGDNADFLFAEYSRIQKARGTWYYSYSNSQYAGSPRVLLQTLDRHEAAFIRACLTGFLFEVGVVELGYDGERLTAVRLSHDGRASQASPAEQGEEASPPPSPGAPAPSASDGDTGRVVVQPSFQILALGPVSLAVLAQLDLFADRQRAGQGAFEYQLSRESVYRAQQLGMGAAEISRFLTEASGVELPQNVRRSLEEWGAHHERIVFRSGVGLLQTATPELLHELMAQPETAPYLARTVAPHAALVATGALDPLVEGLVKRGLFPAISSTDPGSADHSVIIAEDGTIRPIHTVPSLHLRGRLARLAEESPACDGTWCLTPTSVRRAAGNRARVLHLLDELGALHRGPLPEQLVEQVRAWGGYYGDAAVETLTLIEFRDPEALDELRQRPDLRGLLIPFPAGDRALAAVPAGRLAEVKAILAGLGVRVRDGLA